MSFRSGTRPSTCVCLSIKGYTPPYYPVVFNYVLPSVQGYTTEQTHDGWTVTFQTSLLCQYLHLLFGDLLPLRRRNSDYFVALLQQCAVYRQYYLDLIFFREKASFTASRICRRTGRTSVLPVRRHFAASCNVFFKPRAEPNLFGLCRGEEKVRDSELMPFDEKIWQRFLAGFSGKIPFYCRALSLGNGLYVKYSPSPHSVVAWYNTAFDEKLFQ